MRQWRSYNTSTVAAPLFPDTKNIGEICTKENDAKIGPIAKRKKQTQNNSSRPSLIKDATCPLDESQVTYRNAMCLIAAIF